jgi:putative heme-binding domain-containing protein
MINALLARKSTSVTRALLATCTSLFCFGPAHAADLPLATAPADLQVAPGFKVDLLYTVPKEEQGSWVGVTFDHKGRLITTDQYGGLYRITLPALDSHDAPIVEPLAITLPASPLADEERRDKERDDIVGAHGVLYAFDSLYVMVTENFSKQGIWRFRDTDGDDQFDEAKHLRSLNGRGEHAPHSLVLSPDGQSIYIAAGNFTDPAPGLDLSRPVRYGEDHLLPRMWDARGHARGRYAPGGWVGRMDPDGNSFEIFAQGFRNQFDIAFDANGELFTYDSDMEWDIGMPWYVPTRINHIVDAGDYGWRSGAGRWPAYYPDSLPATVDIGPGSPTGTIFGTSAKFPAKYQRALYAADWTYGTLYAIHLSPDGATFSGEKEEFIWGKPLPLTDLLVNPNDGAMYFLVGGRRTQSALYRVTYVGADSTRPAATVPLTAAAKLRHKLELLHAPDTPPETIDQAWPHLGSSDRFIRWAARTAIERQIPSNWAERAIDETDPQASIEALIALARVGEPRYQKDIINALPRINFTAQPLERQLAWLRTWQLAFTRMGPPTASDKSVVLETLDPLFPHADSMVNRMLVELLIYLDSPTVVAKTVPLLKVAEPRKITAEQLGGEALIARNDRYASAVKSATDSRPDRQQIALAYALRNASTGWTPELHQAYFSWFATVQQWMGGASFSGFIANIREEALSHVSDLRQREILTDISKAPVHLFVAGSMAPKGPGQVYTVDEAAALFTGKMRGQNFSRGQAMFSATACVACHQFNDIGGGMGPDLTGAGNRYSVRDLLENIIEPSKVVSDIYETQRFELKDGTVRVGRVIKENRGNFQVMSNPFDPNDLRSINKDEIVSQRTHDVSFMPPGLINGLNGDELRDLVAFILSGGNPQDPMFSNGE